MPVRPESVDSPANAEARHDLAQLFDRIDAACVEQDPISLRRLLEISGRRSFGSTLLVPSLIVLSPLSGIPGLPSCVAILVILMCGQLLLGRRQPWLPDWILRRQLPSARIHKAIRSARPFVSRLDRLSRPRLPLLLQGPGFYMLTVVCLLIAVTMVPLELIPFANSAAGAALSAFGVALVTDDGLFALTALLFSGLVLFLGWYGFAG